MRMTRVARFLRRAPVLCTLLLAACASGNGTGPSQDRTLDLVALFVGTAVIVTIGVLMYHDNRE